MLVEIFMDKTELDKIDTGYNSTLYDESPDTPIDAFFTELNKKVANQALFTLA